MHVFDPGSNPYVDELHHLLKSSPSRYSRAQVRTLASVYVARLYGVDQGGYVDLHGSRIRCKVRVLLEGDSIGRAFKPLSGRLRGEAGSVADAHTYIVLVLVSRSVVFEVFNGPEHVFNEISGNWVGLQGQDLGDMPSMLDWQPTGVERVEPITDSKAWDSYLGVETGDWLWEPHDVRSSNPKFFLIGERSVDFPPDPDDGRRLGGGGADGDGGGNWEGRGGGGDGSGDGNGSGDGSSGSGGVMEVIEHPVLFSAAPSVLARILESLR